MTKLSIIVGGRNDGYGDDKLTPYGIVAPDTFMLRLCRSIKHNLKILTAAGIETSYTVVDWCPVDKLLIDDDDFKSVHQDYPVNYIVVSNDAILKRGYQPFAFHEYYAKNVGIAHSIADYIIVTNPDDLITEELAYSVAAAINEDDDKSYWRCFSRLDVNQRLEALAEGLSFPSPDLFPNNEVAQLEAALGCPAAGDFLLAKKEVIINKGKGYDEENINHRRPSQQYSSIGSYGGSHGGMDSEILTNMYFNGIIPRMLKGSIMHLDHAKPSREGGLMTFRYDNIKNWGFSDFSLEKVSERFSMIKEKNT